MILYYIGFGLFIAVVCYFLNQLQKAERRVEKAYRDGFSAACNMQEPNYDLLNPLNSGIIKDNIELGISSGFDYSKTALYKQGWRDSKEKLNWIISVCGDSFNEYGISVHSLDDLFSFFKVNNKNGKDTSIDKIQPAP